MEVYDANWNKTEKTYEGTATSGNGSNTMYGKPFPLLRGAGRPSGPRMQNVINTVKGKALEVAEYLTPVLKVSRPCEGLAGIRLALQGPRTWRRGVTVVSGG